AMAAIKLIHSRFRRSGFTLVELLVVIAVIGVLIALMIPAIQRSREQARRSQCANNQKQLGLAIQAYLINHGAFPPGYVSAVLADHDDGGPGWAWGAQLMSYLEESALAQQIDVSASLRGEAMAPVRLTSVPV